MLVTRFQCVRRSRSRSRAAGSNAVSTSAASRSSNTPALTYSLATPSPGVSVSSPYSTWKLSMPATMASALQFTLPRYLQRSSASPATLRAT